MILERKKFLSEQFLSKVCCITLFRQSSDNLFHLCSNISLFQHYLVDIVLKKFRSYTKLATLSNKKLLAIVATIEHIF